MSHQEKHQPTNQPTNSEHVSKIFDLIAGDSFASLQTEISDLHSKLNDMQVTHEKAVHDLSEKMTALLAQKESQYKETFKELEQKNLEVTKKHEVNEKMIVKLHDLLSEESQQINKTLSKKMESRLKEFKQNEISDKLDVLTTDLSSKHALTEKMMTRVYNVINQENDKLRKRFDKKIYKIEKELLDKA